MNKKEFLSQLKRKLSGLKKQDINESLNFYSEIIDDKVEDGASVDDAISSLGSLDEIVLQIKENASNGDYNEVSYSPQKRALKPLEIVLLALGSPIWLSLLISLGAVVFSVLVSVWAVVVCLWACLVAFLVSAVAGVLAVIVYSIVGNALFGITCLGVGLIFAGIAIFTVIGCKKLTIGVAILTKKTAIFIKNRFVKREVA